jgi:hypothetical protein
MSTKQTKGNRVAPAEDTQPQIDWSQYGTTGFEKTTTEDLGIPFLAIVQSGSPELKKSHKDYETKKIEGVEEGSIFNTVTRAHLYAPGSEPLIVVPCAYEKTYNEWKVRGDGMGGGGFIRSHSNPAIINECTRNERNQDILPNGNQIVTTGVFFLKYYFNGTWEPAILSMVSTQLKKARQWLNMMMAIKQDGRPLPMFSHKYAITTAAESNANGSWFGWHIEGAGRVVDANLIADAASVAKKIVSGNRPQLGTPTEDVPM